MKKMIVHQHSAARLLKLGAFSLLILAGSLFAAGLSLQGTVTDVNGKPLGGANIKIESKGGNAWSTMTKTDAKGHYSYTGLTADATYRVSLIVNSAVKASINNVKMIGVGPTPQELNFDLKKNLVGSRGEEKKKKTHMVYIPAETGSNLGGRWVEVNDDGSSNPLTPGANNVQKAGGGGLNKLQSNSGAVKGGD